jgi:ABC-type Fe3+/spermidine/putrescine transport system ATPase subunit
MTDTPAVAPVLEALGVERSFTEVRGELTVLRQVDLAVAAGDRIAIIGASGSGKTTLLQILGGLDRPTRGDVRVRGVPRCSPWARPRAASCVTAPSVSSTSFTTCCPSSPRWRTSPCPC